ncbi:MAG: DNA starvation/stationary phase protection protein [Hyphomicrobium sp.]|nr:DNA starvation/stationary phase protection protein [Hyphomicrobium sp.]
MASKKSAKATNEIAEKLGVVLASTYAVQLKIQNFHWNVRGMNFIQLHDLFEKLYEDVDQAVDDIAERIRALGPATPGGLAVFSKLSEIKDAPATPPSEKGMIEHLFKDYEAMRDLCDDVAKAAEDAEDIVTTDLMTQRSAAHQKYGWFLRAHLE